ncbi:hypothetical protein HPB49_011931 [Dermacentor silvarum]|uniref:Uncharacterized protein n=1 Tax=Dermacentor silvarum TaxID=543639 RepID=A0ACB8C918_DERSI|nr:hypothetical protein HPB49_011931 [Dermacentor silvarum]
MKKAFKLDHSSGQLIGFVDLGNDEVPRDADNIRFATKALVFMVVGLVALRKMPFGYFLKLDFQEKLSRTCSPKPSTACKNMDSR